MEDNFLKWYHMKMQIELLQANIFAFSKSWKIWLVLFYLFSNIILRHL